MSTAILYLAVVLLTGCPGTTYPKHNGYRSKHKTPWKKPRRLKIDRDGEGEVDDRVDYSKRQRARWYSLETPSDGNLSLKLQITPGTKFADFDLGFEVYNAKYKVLHRSAADSSDAGELKKSAELSALPQGTYLIHIFNQGRNDRADFELRIKFGKGSAKHSSNFPANVKFPKPLAAVPLFESFSCSRCSCGDNKCKSSCDKCSFCRNCSCRSWKCRRGCPGKCGRVVVRPHRFSCATCNCKASATCRAKCGKKCTTTKAPPSGTVYGAIMRARSAGGGTYVKVNRGKNVGVQVGWNGVVVNKKGAAISGGTFKVLTVDSRSCSGTVSANLGSVIAAGQVRLSP